MTGRTLGRTDAVIERVPLARTRGGLPLSLSASGAASRPTPALTWPAFMLLSLAPLAVGAIGMIAAHLL